jgi:hypothetical protein
VQLLRKKDRSVISRETDAVLLARVAEGDDAAALAKAYGVSEHVARKRVLAALDRYTEREILPPAQVVRRRELAALDEIETLVRETRDGCQPEARSSSERLLLQIAERRTRLLGAEPPKPVAHAHLVSGTVQHEHTARSCRLTAEQQDELVASITGRSVDEIRARRLLTSGAAAPPAPGAVVEASEPLRPAPGEEA